MGMRGWVCLTLSLKKLGYGVEKGPCIWGVRINWGGLELKSLRWPGRNLDASGGARVQMSVGGELNDHELFGKQTNRGT